MFIICSLIRIRTSWEKFVFSLCTNFFCPKGLSCCSSKTRAEYLHDSLWVWFCVDICLVSQFPRGSGCSYFLVSLLLDRSMSLASLCLAGLCQSPCSSEFAALSIAALSLCSSWQQEHHLSRFSLHLWLLFPPAQACSHELLEFTEDLLGLLGDPSCQLYLHLRLHGSSVPVDLAVVSLGKANLELSDELQRSLSSNESKMHHTPASCFFE